MSQLPKRTVVFEHKNAYKTFQIVKVIESKFYFTNFFLVDLAARISLDSDYLFCKLPFFVDSYPLCNFHISNKCFPIKG